MTQKWVSALLPTATFGNNLGYRFTADVVELNADIQCSPSAPVSQDWALQLWADDAIKIAELPLGPLLTDDLGRISVSGAATARIPAGERFRALSLSLVSGARGVYDCFHDRREFACLQRFQQPCLKGDIECRFGADELTIDIAEIENPRDAGNISGTLALEVWSLEAPYEGDAWNGVLIASLIIGCLNGQSACSNNHFVAHAAPLPATGHLTLMLREWTPDGYATRDYRPLAHPINSSNVAKSSAVQEPGESSTENSAVQEPGESSVAQAGVAESPAATLDEQIRAKGMVSRLVEKVRRYFGL